MLEGRGCRKVVFSFRHEPEEAIPKSRRKAKAGEIAEMARHDL
jgi:hypothetical protein